MAFPFDFSHIVIDDRFAEGERSSVRRMNLNDPKEISRLFAIEGDPGVAQFVEGLQSSEEDLIAFGNGSEERLPIAIEGKEGFVDFEEVGKLQGWVYLYPDEDERLNRLKEQNIGSNYLNGRTAVEISYAKYPGAVKGQMSSGLRQMVKILTAECIKYSVRMVVVAYTDGINYDSKRLLMATGFEQVGEIEYHNGADRKDDVWMLPIN
jgi:hypothetical protein